MKIGVPKEIKPQENRIGLTPDSVEILTSNGHEVLVENNGGFEAGFDNDQYTKAGAKIVKTAGDIFNDADIIVKVKEPQKEEFKLLRENQIVFTYFHFASSKALTEAMIKSKSVCIAYETVEDEDGTLPLLTPMSEVAGRMAIQQGAKYLEKPVKGRGILLGGVPGVSPGKVLILGAGVVGVQAAKMAAGLGAHVTIMDVNMKRLRYVNDVLPSHVVTDFSSEYSIRQKIKNHDLIIGGVLLKGANSIVADNKKAWQLFGTDSQTARAGLGDILSGFVAGSSAIDLTIRRDIPTEFFAKYVLLHSFAASKCKKGSNAFAIGDELSKLIRNKKTRQIS